MLKLGEMMNEEITNKLLKVASELLKIAEQKHNEEMSGYKDRIAYAERENIASIMAAELCCHVEPVTKNNSWEHYSDGCPWSYDYKALCWAFKGSKCCEENCAPYHFVKRIS